MNRIAELIILAKPGKKTREKQQQEEMLRNILQNKTTYKDIDINTDDIDSAKYNQVFTEE